MNIDEIKIESGIPIPPKQKSGRKPKYPLRKMKVGDSFSVDGYTGKAHSAAISACRANHWPGFKFVVRRTVEDGKQVTRIWRVK